MNWGQWNDLTGDWKEIFNNKIKVDPGLKSNLDEMEDENETLIDNYESSIEESEQ